MNKAGTLDEAFAIMDTLEFPVVVRPSFILRGAFNNNVAYNRTEFVAIVQRGLRASPTREVLIEASLYSLIEKMHRSKKDAQTQ
jgi:carbamoyl-phosphate synthase large subunit